jgi:outer membrane protein
MKKLIVLLLMVLPLGAFAQETKIAFVNAEEVFMIMPEIKSVEKTMADLNAKYDTEFKQMEAEFTKKYTDFSAQQDSLTENIKLRRMDELKNMEERMRNFMDVAKQDVGKKQQELVEPIQKKLQDAIKAVGDEKGYTYILNPQVLLYKGSGAIDATPFVKTKLGI